MKHVAGYTVSLCLLVQHCASGKLETEFTECTVGRQTVVYARQFLPPA